VRDFKNPYYDGPDCVCCKDKLDAKQVREILNQERSEWGLGTMVARIIDKLISQIFK
jgi:hypothetical protein